MTGLIVTALRWLAWTRMILKSDNEPALLQLMRTAAGWAKVELQEIDQLGEEHPTAYDSQANGAVESGIRNVRADLRTMRLDLEDRLSAQLPIGHPMMAWLVRHVGFCHTAFAKGADGRTAWQTVRGRVYGQRLYHFGEKVHWKLPMKGPRSQPRGNTGEKWQTGIYLGNEYEANSYVVSIGDTTVSSRAVIRYPDPERWSRESVEAVAAFPWTTREDREPPVALGEPREPAPAPEVDESKSFRRFKINPADIQKFGTTRGCTQCDHINHH